MTAFNFADLTNLQAMALTGDDIITFAGGSARLAVVNFDLTPGVTTITFGGHSVDFDPRIVEIASKGGLHFADGSQLLIGGPRTELFDGGAGNDAIFAGDGNDTLLGEGGDNVLQGNQGDDSILSGQGADKIFGGQGNDVIVSGAGVASEHGDFVQGNKGDDAVTGGGGADTLLGGQGNDTIVGGGGADFLNGNLGDDSIVGGSLADTILGEAGNDTISGRDGADVISGGAGQDLFVITSRFLEAAELPRVVDWEHGDHLHFSGASEPGAATATNYAEIQSATFTDARSAADRLIAGGVVDFVVAQVGGDLIVFADPDGHPAAEAAVILTGRSLADIDPGNII